MAGFLYFLPGQNRGIKIADLQAAGLGYAFERRMSPREVLGGGPDGNPGVVVADPESVPDIGYYADRQTWRKIPGSRNWLGYLTHNRPTPADLQRDQVLDGHWITLADGNEWLVPIARGSVEETFETPGGAKDTRLAWCRNLPEATSIDDDEGHWIRDGVLARYRPLWDTATRWWDARSGAKIPDAEEGKPTRVTFDFDGTNDGALLALQANYRVSKIEAAALGLFDDQCVVEILDALIDWPTIEAWLKKKARSIADSSSTDDGPPVDGPATDPQLPISGP